VTAPARALDEAEIRRRLDRYVAAIRAMDLETLKPLYAPEMVSFDIEPPLRHVGAPAKWKNWARVFTIYQPPLDYEIRDLVLFVGDEVAFGYSLNRISGTLKGGQRNAYWVRWTPCFRKLAGQWLLAHDQVSVPVDFASGRALLDLQPE
jgi:ketosteroid isomerase-like protein